MCCCDIEQARDFLRGLREDSSDPMIAYRVEVQGFWKGDVKEAMRQMNGKASMLLERSVGLDEHETSDFLNRVNEFNAWIYEQLGSGIGM